MTTKDQEREALKKIRKIVEGLGEESYIGKAFEGCFEMAQENIESDFWMSWKETAELNRIEAETWMDKALELEKEIKGLKKAEQEIAERYELQKAELREEIQEGAQKTIEAQERYLAEKKELRIKAKGQEETLQGFNRIVFVPDGVKPFVTVFGKNNWATSYRIEELEILDIQ